jgi:superfamily I DNA/RNA helicase
LSVLRLPRPGSNDARDSDRPGSLEAAEKAEEVARVYARYEELKATSGCVDFGDLVMRPVVLLERDEAVRTQLQERLRPRPGRRVSGREPEQRAAPLGPQTHRENLWVVGDSKQSIYRFRGASSFNMARFGREDFPGGVRDSLDINYRSSSEIVGASLPSRPA